MRHAALMFFVSGFTGLILTRCASPQLRTEIVEQQRNNEEAEEIVEKYIPKGKDRTTVTNALAKSTELLGLADKARSTAEAEAKEAEADAGKWHWIRNLGIAALAAGALFGGFKLFRLVSP